MPASKIRSAERPRVSGSAATFWTRRSELDSTADLVYTGRGAINWLHDMDGWAAVVARLLKPGGKLYVYEGHPLTWIWDQEATELRLDPVYGDYFQTAVQSEQGWGPTYVGELSKPKEELTPQSTRRRRPSARSSTRCCKRRPAAGKDGGTRRNVLGAVSQICPPNVVARLPNTFSLLMRKDGVADGLSPLH